MLALDDPRWNELQHAYGAASDIPALLRGLATSPARTTDSATEPWFSLWSSLCHQGDVYSASYAALPHIVGIALTADAPIDASFLVLPASIEVARQTGRGPTLPTELADSYRDAISGLVDIVSRHRHEAWDQAMVLAASAALAAAKGHVWAAEALLNLDDDWIAAINAGTA